MRDQRAAPARAEGSGDATTAADRQSGDTTDDDPLANGCRVRADLPICADKRYDAHTVSCR